MAQLRKTEVAEFEAPMVIGLLSNFGHLPGRHILTHGFKLLGIASWTVYFVRTSTQTISPFVQSR